LHQHAEGGGRPRSGISSFHRQRGSRRPLVLASSSGHGARRRHRRTAVVARAGRALLRGRRGLTGALLSCTATMLLLPSGVRTREKVAASAGRPRRAWLETAACAVHTGGAAWRRFVGWAF